jgi:RNA polymerase sigma-70 factor (ECF subfamily)
MHTQMIDPHAEERLVLQAQNGDRTAFGRLVEQYEHRLEAIVRARMGTHLRGKLEVADVVQESFTRALQSLGAFRWQGEGSFLRWLGGIAENLLVKTASREARDRPLRSVADLPAAGTSPSRILRREERLRRLEKALEGLPADYREVIRLARIQGLKHEAIATRMGRSHAAIRQLVIRALRKLRESFPETESLNLASRVLRLPRDEDRTEGRNNDRP